MPRTRSTKGPDTRPPAEKLAKICSAIDLWIFFNYYDGIVSSGLVGFDPLQPLGSTSHKNGNCLLNHLTNAQFRAKGKKMGLLAKEFVDQNIVPAREARPALDSEASVQELVRDIERELELKRDKRSPDEKLDAVTIPVQLFIFFNYYDGERTDGTIGFNPRSGPPGCINHKRAFPKILGDLTPTIFRLLGNKMAGLANEFISKGIIPSEEKRPNFPRAAPTGLLRGADEAQWV
jgi:hypothetical protein